MIDGSELWGEEVRRDLRPVTVGSQTFLTWDHAPNSAADMLFESAGRDPGRTALRMDGGRDLTFSELDWCVREFASRLRDVGVARGVRVGVLLPNGLEFVVSFLALNAAGAVFCPLPGKLSSQEVANLVRRARMDLLITDERFAEQIREHLPRLRTLRVRLAEHEPVVEIMPADTGGALVLHAGSRGLIREGSPAPDGNADNRNPDDDAIVMFTSGTTSAAKGVVITNRAVVHAAIAYERVLGLTDEDIAIIAVPMYHITGIVAIISVMIRVGGTLVIQSRFRAVPFLQAVMREDVTFIHASPTVFQMLLQARDRFPEVPTVRVLACGAAHMPVSWIEEIHDWMPLAEFRTVYGLTESTSPATVSPRDVVVSDHLGASGLPIPGLRLKICDDSGSEVPGGCAGEILISGTNIARGYDSPAGVREPEDGWFHTGDIGRADPDGYLYVVDRLKDVVNRGGEKIWCTDVEEALREMPDVRDACVVGVPDPLFGEVPAAAVVTEEGIRLTADHVRNALSSRLGAFEIPVIVVTVDEIPLTPGLKVDKRAVRALLEHASS